MKHSSLFGGIGKALSNRPFRRYWASNAVSTIGRWIYRTAVGWLVWELTRDPKWLGIVAFADLFPMVVLSIVAGAISDRVGYVRVIRLSQIGMCLMLETKALFPTPARGTAAAKTSGRAMANSQVP